MLSFTKGKPIAAIKGGRHNKKTLKLTTDEKEMKDAQIDPFIHDYINDNWLNENAKHKRMSIIKMNKMYKALSTKTPPTDDEDMLNVYNKAIDVMNNISKKDFKVYDGKIIKLPNNDEEINERCYIAGPTGSGKSTYCLAYIKQYQKMYPNNEVYLFSRLDEDKVLDSAKPNRIELDEKCVENPIQPQELENSLCVFDDIDTIPDLDVRHAIKKLRDDLLECGRHYHISLLCTSHQLLNYHDTRQLINECSSVTFFPKSGSSFHINNFLTKYCGLDRKAIKKINDLPSRAVTISKTYPMYIIYDNGCYLL
jgi:hypothetical protein